VIPFPDKKYKIIYADPPWQYENKKTGGSNSSGSEQKYETMSYEELANLPIQSITDEDCILFLWATIPLLPLGVSLMNDWGFKYKTSLVWFKSNSYGLGYWFRGMTEILLIGVSGKVKPFRSQMPNCISCPIQKHSKKPDRFRQIISSITKDLQPRIELFARMKIHGWDTWGNDNNLNNEPLEMFNQ